MTDPIAGRRQLDVYRLTIVCARAILCSRPNDFWHPLCSRPGTRGKSLTSNDEHGGHSSLMGRYEHREGDRKGIPPASILPGFLWFEPSWRL